MPKRRRSGAADRRRGVRFATRTAEDAKDEADLEREYASVKQALLGWDEAFAESHGRAPTEAERLGNKRYSTRWKYCAPPPAPPHSLLRDDDYDAAAADAAADAAAVAAAAAAPPPPPPTLPPPPRRGDAALEARGERERQPVRAEARRTPPPTHIHDVSSAPEAQLLEAVNRFTRHDADLDGLLSVSEYCTLMRELLGGEAKGGGAGDEIGDGDGDDEADAEVGLLGLQRATAHATEQERLAFAKADKTGAASRSQRALHCTHHARRNSRAHDGRGGGGGGGSGGGRRRDAASAGAMRQLTLEEGTTPLMARRARWRRSASSAERYAAPRRCSPLPRV